MGEFIATAWDWLGKSSGQIQILIAAIAFGYAYKGYLRVLDQLELSKNQEEIAIDQRDLNLKLQTLDMLVRALESNQKHQAELYEIRAIVKNKWQSMNQESEKSQEEFINDLDSKIAIVEDARQQLISLMKSYSALEYKGATKRPDLLSHAMESMHLDAVQSQTISFIKHRMK